MFMWLAKLFGGQKRQLEIVEDEEPARFPSDTTSMRTGPQTDFNKRRAREANGKPSGFDPYNSGTFKKDDAWKRVTRR
jgi:hypothetical protein